MIQPKIMNSVNANQQEAACEGHSRKRRLMLLDLLSPSAYALFVGVTLIITAIDNPIGWASTYAYFKSINPEIGVIYISSFLCVSAISRFLFSRRKRGVLDHTGIDQQELSVNIKFALRLFWVAAFFQAYKFVNIGSIPLFGSPLDRYKLTLGGFEDYPSRLLAPIATLFFCHGVTRGRLTIVHWLVVAVAAVLNIFMTQRQEVVNLILGCGFVWVFNKRAKFWQLASLVAAILIVAYVTIGLGAVARYGGAGAISNKVSPIELPIWIVHGELTVPYVFGEHIIAQLNGKLLYGLYTFGEFIAIFSPVKILHGASLTQNMFTNADTAQSVGAPYSYFIDFGYYGLIFIGVMNSLIMNLFYRGAMLNRNSSYWTASYAMLFISAFWSIRSGISIMYPLVIYILSGMFCSTKGGGRFVKQIRSVARIIFFSSLCISFSALIFRH
jgi:oligosaccharide repeat unit polymerase